MLGEQLGINEYLTPRWWPAAQTELVRAKLGRRIVREGWLVPSTVAVCFSLLRTMYSTVWVPTDPKYVPTRDEYRVRFQYRGIPISDFGIAKGEVDLAPWQKIAYFDKSGEQLPSLQDPKDHIWIYFTTLKGEELLLDCGIYPFDNCMTVQSKPYNVCSMDCFGAVPILFKDGHHARTMPNIHKKKKSFSVLRDFDLLEVTRSPPSLLLSNVEFKAALAFMEKVAERESTDTEKRLLRTWISQSLYPLITAVQNRSWRQWPKDLPLGYDADPGQSMTNEVAEHKDLVKLSRRYNRGDITAEDLAKGIAVLELKHALGGA